MAKRKPKPGDLVEVAWEDIASGSAGHPEAPVFKTVGYWRGYVERDGREYLVTDHDKLVSGEDYKVQWDIYPVGVVLGVVCL